MGVDQVIEKLQEASDEDRGKALEALFPPEERATFAQAVTNAATINVRAPKTSPSARRDFDMAYDAARKRVVLFGGWLSA
ncbi:MAG: hypothetical protein V3T48_04585, partial [Vicinamibacterales bacterium]